MISFFIPKQQFEDTSSVVIERVLAWKAALAGWAWASLLLLSGLLFGVATANATNLIHAPLFWAWGAAMAVLFQAFWGRLKEIAQLGMLNFTVARLGWMLVFTVLWVALTAAPTGAYQDLFSALVNLQTQPEAIRAQVIGSLVLGQGLILLSALAWIIFVFSLFVATARRSPQVGATLMAIMLLFCGLALGFGAHTTGQLMILALSQ